MVSIQLESSLDVVLNKRINRKDATLREVLTALRNTAPLVPEYRHPLARFSFRTVYADSTAKGRFQQKELGMVYSRDILGEPGSLGVTAPRLREDADGEAREPSEREKEERTLDELRFVPGDYLLIAVLLPKNVGAPTEIAIKGSAGAGVPQTSNGWRSGAAGAGRGDGGWGGAIAAPSGPGAGRGGGHWRGDSNPTPSGPRGGRGGRGGGDLGRDRDRDRDVDRADRRVPPPRRGDRSDSPPTRGRGGWGRGGRGGRGGGRSRSRTRSRSRSRSPPPPPRRRRYD